MRSTVVDRSPLLLGAAAASVGAGVIHAYTAFTSHHLEHIHVTAFFALIAVAQIAWADYARTTRRIDVLVAGLLVNAGVLAVWLVSRTVGIPFIPGVGEPEPVGALDIAAGLLEVAIVAGTLYLVRSALTRRILANPRTLAAGAMVVGLTILALPAILGRGGPSGAHGHDAGSAIAPATVGHTER